MRFNYVIELEFGDEKHMLPSITVCLNESHHDDKNDSNIYRIPFEIFAFRDHHLLSFNQLVDHQIYARYSFKTMCLTYFYNSNEYYFGEIYFKVFYYQRVKLIIHLQNNPSQFEKNNIIECKMEHKYIIHLKKFQRNLLTSPYDTNCQDYSSVQQNNNGFKSQTDCKLDYMRRKELEICGKNYYWIQYPFVKNNHSMNFSQTVVNCTVRLDEILLNRLCKPDCLSIDLSHDTINRKRSKTLCIKN